MFGMFNYVVSEHGKMQWSAGEVTSRTGEEEWRIWYRVRLDE